MAVRQWWSSGICRRLICKVGEKLGIMVVCGVVERYGVEAFLSFAACKYTPGATSHVLALGPESTLPKPLLVRAVDNQIDRGPLITTTASTKKYPRQHHEKPIYRRKQRRCISRLNRRHEVGYQVYEVSVLRGLEGFDCRTCPRGHPRPIYIHSPRIDAPAHTSLRRRGQPHRFPLPHANPCFRSRPPPKTTKSSPQK